MKMFTDGELFALLQSTALKAGILVAENHSLGLSLSGKLASQNFAEEMATKVAQEMLDRLNSLQGE